MSYQDKSLQCSDCGITFIHSAKETEIPFEPHDGWLCIVAIAIEK